MTAADALRETAAAVLILSGWTLAGWPLARRLPGRATLLAAPVLGFGWLAIAATWLYRLGLPPRAGLLLVLAAAAWEVVRALRARRQPTADATAPGVAPAALAGGLLTLLLLLLPHWLGPPRFSIFQGNHFDQRNYVAAAVAYRLHPWAELNAIDWRASDPWAGLDTRTAPRVPTSRPTGYALFAARNLDNRPSVSIAYAALADLVPGSLVTSAYLYVALLQWLWYCAAAWIGVALLQAGPARAAVVALALAVGAFAQYVFDIGAWAQMVGVPLLVLALGAGIAVLAQAGRPGRVWRAAAAMALALVPATYLYPEGLLACVLPWLAACWSAAPQGESRARLGNCGALALAAALVALACLPSWDSTLAFLGRQFTQGVGAQPVRGWAEYFNGHVFGDGSNPLLPIPRVLRAAHGFFGELGLYFLAPPQFVGPLPHAAWELALLAGAVALIALLAVRGHAALRAGGPWAAWTAAALVTPVGPLGLWAVDLPWQAGKVWSMLTPLVFLGLARPLLAETTTRGAVSWLALVFVGLHLGFGGARVLAAGDASGRPFPPPYPNAMDPALKLDHEWDLAAVRASLRGCRDVALSLEDPWVEAYVTADLADRGVAWFPRHRQREYDTGRALGQRDQRRRDCVLAQGPVATNPGERVIAWPARPRALLLSAAPHLACPEEPARTPAAGAGPPVRGDVDGDGHPDLLFQLDFSDEVLVWRMSAELCRRRVMVAAPVPEPGVRLSAVADLDGDGRGEWIFETPQGTAEAWVMQPLAPPRRDGPAHPLHGEHAFPGTWHVAAAADIDHDGRDDLLWQDSATGRIEAWTMDGYRCTSIRSPDPSGPGDSGWKLVAAPDVDHDGLPDLLFQNIHSGRAVVWRYDRSWRRIDGFLLRPDTEGPSWSIGAWLGGDVLVWSQPTARRLRAWRLRRGGVRAADQDLAPGGGLHGGQRLAGPR